MIPHKAQDPYDWPAVLHLLQASFTYMTGRIDPPSSLATLDAKAIADHARTHEVWIIGAPPLACMFLTPQPGALYIGKLAVAEGHRNKGHGRTLITVAEERARALSLPRMTLQARVELVENHAAFAALGFAEVTRTAHPGYMTPTAITFSRLVPAVACTPPPRL